MPFELKTIHPAHGDPVLGCAAEPGGWLCYHAPEVENAGIAHGFMAADSGEILRDEGRRAAFTAALGAKDMVVLDQQHGDTVHVIAAGERPKAGDGLVITEPDVIGVIKTADCLPVIIYAPGHPVCAIVHAGWRGTALTISRKAVAAMVRMGISPASMGALIGPGIGPCCYNVGEDVVASFNAAGIGDGVFTRRDSLTFLDLKKANRQVLISEGVRDIDDADLCTSCKREMFFSARRDKSAGRQVNFVLIKG